MLDLAVFVGVCRGVVGVKKQATPTQKKAVSIYDYHVYVGVVGVISIYVYMLKKRERECVVSSLCSEC